MTIPTFSSITINDLAEFTFIGGTEQELYFDIYDSSGNAVNLGGSSISWKLSPYGQPSYAVLTLTGSCVVYSGSPTNRFIVTIPSSESKALSGKYVHQPVLVDVDGVEYRPSQGVITIIPRIETT